MLPSSRLSRVTRVLGGGPYATFTAGNAASLVGTWMHRVAVGWLTWELTHSAAWLGAIAFADLFPTVIVAPLAGAAADRCNRLRILRIAAAIAAGLAAALFALSLVGTLSIFALFAVTLGLGIVTGIGQPARLALIAALVPREDLTTAVAINSIVFNLARFIGPALAGIAISGGGVTLVFAANALSYAAFLLALFRLPGACGEQGQSEESPCGPGDPGGPGGRGGSSFGRELVAGLRYTARHPAIAPLLGLLLVTNVCGRPFVELLPGFAVRVFDAGPQGLALMTSAIGLGAIAGAAWLIGRSETQRLAAVTILSTLTLAVAISLFVMTDRLVLALPILVLAGTAMVGAGVGTHTLLQLIVAPAMRGRVLSLYGLIFRGGPAIGALSMGPLADRVGLSAPVGAGALIVAAATLTLFLRYRTFVGSLELARNEAARENRG